MHAAFCEHLCLFLPRATLEVGVVAAALVERGEDAARDVLASGASFNGSYHMCISADAGETRFASGSRGVVLLRVLPLPATASSSPAGGRRGGEAAELEAPTPLRDEAGVVVGEEERRGGGGGVAFVVACWQSNAERAACGLAAEKLARRLAAAVAGGA